MAPNPPRTLLLVALLAPLLSPMAFGAGEDDPGEAEIRSEELVIGSHDGTQLAATLWYDAAWGEGNRSLVLAAHGWSQDRHVMESTARWLVEAGHLVLAWDARGFGESEGTVGLNGPEEWADVSAIIDHLATGDPLPDGTGLRMDADDDPRIGMVGGSYGGAIQLLAAAQDARIDAVVPDITWHDLVESLAPDGIVKRGWVDLLYGAGFASSHGMMNQPPQPNAGGMDERLTRWFAEATVTGRLPDDAVGPLLERSPRSHNADVDAHVLLTQGWHDTLFPPQEATANYHALREREHAETHLMLYAGGHGHTKTGDPLETYRERVDRFLERHLQDADVDPLPPVTVHEPRTGNWTHLETWPPIHEDPPRELTADDGSSTLTLAVKPTPTSHSDTQAFAGELPRLQQDLLDNGPTPTAVQLETGLNGPLDLQGQPRVGLTITPDAEDFALFFSLVETQGEDSQVLYNQVTPVRIDEPPGIDTRVNLTLPGLAHTVQAGKSLHLRVTTSDTGFHGTRNAGTVDLHLEDAVIELPGSDQGLPIADPDEPEAQAAAPGPGILGVLILLGIGVTVQRRNLHESGPSRTGPH